MANTENPLTTKTITVQLPEILWDHIKANLTLKRMTIMDATVTGLCSVAGVDREAIEKAALVSESTNAA